MPIDCEEPVSELKGWFVFFASLVLIITNFNPVSADKVSTDVTIKESIPLPSCPATQQTPVLVHQQQDQDGNKIKIFCTQGRFLMVYITSSGTTYYIGGCFFDSGQNLVSKLVHYDRYTIFSNGTKKGENSTFTRVLWYNFNAPQQPARVASNASDYDFDFDPATEILMKYNTTHNGFWATSKNYTVLNMTKVANKTITNPDDPQKLISFVAPRGGEMATIPTDYAFTTPFPVTVLDNGTLSTIVFTEFQNNTFQTTPISAKEGIPFTFDVDYPGEDLGVVKYSLLEPPDGMTIDQKSGIISWTPTQGQAGSYDITVKVQDDLGSSIHKFSLPVEAAVGPTTSNNNSLILIVGIIAAIIIGIVIVLRIRRSTNSR